MKINLEFLEELSNIRKSLGAPLIEYKSEYKINTVEFNDGVVNKILGTFKEVLEKIELKIEGKPLLDKDGNCRFLYIPDHTWHRYSRNKRYNKVHITYCEKLQEMEQSKKVDKYSFTTNTSGEFEINLPYDKKELKRLNVCKLCIKSMKSTPNIYIDDYGSFEYFDFKKFSEDFRNKYPKVQYG